MKNKKGFTLIELLAVIVILAIIALIAVPIVLNMINGARKSAAKSTALGYIDAIEYNNGFASLGSDTGVTGYTPITSGDVSTITSTLGSHLKGKAPTSGSVVIDPNGKVSSATLCVSGYNVSYNGKDATVGGSCSSNSNNQQTTYETYNPGDLLYFDPTSSTTTCSSTTSSTNAVTCYKWRVITVDDDNTKENITVQMDHNLVVRSVWTPSNTSTGPTTVLSNLANSTSTWNRVPTLNYTYDTTAATNNYGVLTCDNGICNKTVNNTETFVAGTEEKPVRARLITGEEVRALTLYAGAEADSNAGTWTLASSSSDYYYFSNIQYIIGTHTKEEGNTTLSWLVENTKSSSFSGSTANAYSIENKGYWTLSPFSGESSRVWLVCNYGGMDITYYVFNDEYGARPVITMPKSVFSS